MRQVTLETVRDEAVRTAKAIHDKKFTKLSEEGIRLIDITIPPDERDDLFISVYIVQNTMSPHIYGANILVEHYHCSLDSVNGYVNFEIPLLEVVDKPLISQEQVKIINIDTKLLNKSSEEEIKQHIADEWNQVS